MEEGNRNKIVCFGGEIAGENVVNPNAVLGSSPGEDVGFRIFFSVVFNDTYRMISFKAIEIDMKCKHLSNFAAVTAGTLLVL
jgi:hypothetical protein